ncbi:NADPH-dependent FMN reductase [Psychromarinibacter halotolerans]|uniref:NADPH-dependent FMN reductase n=1 Tax=Psychromarinibacter halotolerans TaxID=1775175 RepID=A0ABV7GW91_9RHOB|nr:NAD(P)H-dependent oxidoreductase [Psychromarinibacter halotolerans]MAQ84644.1 NADPH-dependent FMN reductase [Maritimibacter sp.]MDF0598635.1 NAD(P)H-dependent oxidoreductase [Psychromarinibacter halotolerans]
MADYKLLSISGALRAGSTNRKLLAEAMRLFGPAEVTIADLRLPLYDGDLEDADGIPDAVQTLSDQIAAADGVVISSPEYNRAVTGVIKNALDWVSRTKGGPWSNKPVAVMSANDGRAGGEVGQYMLRHALTPFRPRFVPGPFIAVADSSNAFDADGRLVSDRYAKSVETLMQALKSEIDMLRRNPAG